MIQGRQGSGAHPSTQRAARLPAALGALLISATFGCAYSFSGSALPAHIKSVAVPTFGNQTVEPELAQQLTAALTDRLVEDGRLKLASESQAQARFDAQVVSYENKVLNYTADQSPRDYIVIITVSLALRDVVRNREIWKDEALKATSIYKPSDTTATITTEDAARKDAMSSLTRDIVNRTLESW
ncbi:MAG: LPS assembly lipoprotein LptE [Candidatus Eisenbacteria bacterium]